MNPASRRKLFRKMRISYPGAFAVRTKARAFPNSDLLLREPFEYRARTPEGLNGPAQRNDGINRWACLRGEESRRLACKNRRGIAQPICPGLPSEQSHPRRPLTQDQDQTADSQGFFPLSAFTQEQATTRL